MTKRSDPTPAAGGDANHDGLLMNAATRITQSMADVLVGHLPFDVTVRLLKQAYLDAAYRKLKRQRPDKRITKSALALMSGLDTRVIKSLEEARTQPAADDLSQVLPYSCVLNNWAFKPEWQDPVNGRPRRLKIYGNGLTFRTLVVRSIAKNISYQPVLDELARTGNVRIIEGEYVELCDHIPDQLSANTARTLDLGSLAVSALQGTIAHNAALVEGDKRRRGWLAAEEHIPSDKVPEVQRRVEEIIDQSRLQVVALLESYRDTGAADKSVAGAGMFFWRAEEQD